ncbi:hypothetical protein VKT23_004811 [Stygiomarasmius scandens]|uniref:F-box domain-containing protein n=1 Tax=Marasmiellus scandens TaxID=2682957 RepID=A0ABR1JRW3_9AGAR
MSRFKLSQLQDCTVNTVSSNRETTIVLCDRCSAALSSDEIPHSPVSDEQLRSMHIPSGLELTQMLSVVEDCQRDLDNHDEEIGRLSKVLGDLRKQRDKLQNQRDRYAYMCSSIRKLPVEILAQIFAECCDEHSLFINKSGIGTPALDLSQTCSFWRRVMLSRPEFWSGLYIDIVQADEYLYGFNLVDLHLNRSEGGSGLTLDVTASVLREEYSFYVTANGLNNGSLCLLESLFSTRHRWVAVHFDLDWSIYEIMHRHLTSTSDPQTFEGQWRMKTLSLEWRSIPVHLKCPAFFYILGEASTLRSLSLSSFRQQFPFPFQNLQQLQITHGFGTDLSELLSLLKQCNNLQALNIQAGYRDGLDDSEELLQITLKNLSSLTFTFSDCEQGSRFISAITCPSLVTLSITYNDYAGYDPLEERPQMISNLESFFQRSACCLSVLEFSCVSKLFYTDAELTKLLQLIPSVTNLVMDLYEYEGVLNDNFFQSLSFGNTPYLLPKLQSFCLEFMENEQTPESSESPDAQLPEMSDNNLSSLPKSESIITLINSRRSLVEDLGPCVEKLGHFGLSFRLKSDIGLSWVQDFRSNIESRLRALEKSGMSLSLDGHLHKRSKLPVPSL